MHDISIHVYIPYLSPRGVGTTGTDPLGRIGGMYGLMCVQPYQPNLSLILSPDGASIISEKSAEAGLDVGPISIHSLPCLSGTANADLLTRGRSTTGTNPPRWGLVAMYVGPFRHAPASEASQHVCSAGWR